MASKILKGIELKRESRPYIDCLYSVLTHAGKFSGQKYLMAGMTGFSFIFVVHRDLILASTEMYELSKGARRALEMLGYYSEIYDGLKTNLTFPLYQKRAVERIKESIDQGMAVIVWAPDITDFGIIYGYDEDDKVFFFKNRYHREEKVLLYKNLGRVEAAYWMCQIIGESVEKDIRDIYLDSIEYAVDSWEAPYVDEIALRREIASGRRAYKYLIDALKREEIYDLGAAKILYYNPFMKEESFLYFQEVIREFPELSSVCEHYRVLDEIYKKIMGMIPPQPAVGREHEYRLDRKKALPEIIACLTQASLIEDKAMEELRNFMRERLDNRYIDINDVKKFG